MSNKNRLLFVGLFLAIVIGGYVIFGAMANKGGSATQPSVPTAPETPSGNVQDVYIKALGSGGYDNPQVSVKKDIPVKLHFSAEANTGCGRQMILDGFNVKLVSQNGENQVAEFTPTQAGTYAYHCGMNMYRGKMIVTN